MKNIKEKISGIDWDSLTQSMDEKGFAIVQQLLSSEIIKRKDYNQLEQDVRKAIVLIQKLRALYPAKI